METIDRDPISSNINLDYLIKSIQANRCILCIGPDFFSDHTGKRQESQLAHFLREKEDALQIRVYDDGWFHSKGESEVEAWQRVREFYEQPNERGETLLKKIVQIPFHLVLSFTPDYRIRDAFKGLGGHFFSFNKYEPLIIAGEPTNAQPAVINLLGELNNRNSLVLTQSDYYQFLKAIFEKKFLPELIKDQIAKAEYIIFLGMSLDKWYLQLFMQLLKEFDRQKMTPSRKFSTDSFLDQATIVNCEEQFRILFDINDAEVFIHTLHQKCDQGENILRLKPQKESAKLDDQPTGLSMIHIQNWLKYIAEDNIEKTLSEMALYLNALNSPDLIREITLLNSRFNNIKNSFRQGLITRSEESTGRTNIANALIDMVQSVNNNLAT